MMKIDSCQLCLEHKALKQSHIIPSFVGKWIKDTSVTGYLRQLDNPNIRKQDIVKQKLLCGECEARFSKYESLFADNIFYPYVNHELDDWGVAKGKIKSINYSSWLLKFVISLQWRALVTHSELPLNSINKKKFGEKINDALLSWSDYLLGNREDSGDERHYIVFLQNLTAGVGDLPENINERVNTYLLRSVDTTLAFSSNNLFLYSKMGPIVIISGLKPQKLRNMNDALIRHRGKIITAQHLRNSFVNEFIFVTRPNEAFSKYNISDMQDRKIASDIKKKAKDSKHLHSLKTAYSDKILRERLGRKKSKSN